MDGRATRRFVCTPLQRVQGTAGRAGALSINRLSSADAGLQTTALSFAEMDESVAGRLADKTQRRHHGPAKLKLQAKSASSPCAACASSSFFDSKIDMLHAGRDAIFQGGSTSGRFFCTPKGCNGTAWIVQCAVQYPTMCTLTLV